MLWVQALVFCGGLIYAAVDDLKTRTVCDIVCIIIAAAGLITISPASLLGALLAMAPIVVSFPALLGKLPGHKGIRGLEIFSHRKAPAIVKQNRLPDHIALIVFQSSTSLKSGHFGTNCPKAPQHKC